RTSSSDEFNDELYALTSRSNFSTSSYPGYMVNGVKFLVDKRDSRRNTQNCSVRIPRFDGNYFYGVLEQVLELSYIRGFNVVLFRCRWFDTDPRKKWIQQDEQFTSIYTVLTGTRMTHLYLHHKQS
ncbi:hypothetical protein TorRG33x02_067740, partial [Trema orientale]